MPRFNVTPFIQIGLVLWVGVGTFWFMGSALSAVAAPLHQTGVVSVISDPPPPAQTDQFSDLTLLQDNLQDPGGTNQWRQPTYDDSNWQNSYAAARDPNWGEPLGNAALGADFIWGGSPGTGPDANGRYEAPNNPINQYLFIRKNFCIPLNANSFSVTSPMDLEVAVTPDNPPISQWGKATLYYNGRLIQSGLIGNESGTVEHPVLDPTTFNPETRAGRNTLALRVSHSLLVPGADSKVGVAYHLQVGYTIDSNALTISANPASPSVVNSPIAFSQTTSGLGGDGPYSYQWNFGDGTTSNVSNPTKSYTTAGTYTVVMTATDRFGCASTPTTIQYTVLEASPTPTFTPITSAPVDDGGDDDDDDDDDPPTPTPTPVISIAVASTPTATASPTPSGPMFLPETGRLDAPASQPPDLKQYWLLGLALLSLGYYIIRRVIKE